jgi:2,4-dihydroxyhept-2-ene-1,7-dioic acid aldolase
MQHQNHTLGIGAIYIGPSDLSMVLGKEPRKGMSDPEVIAAIETILAAARRDGMPAGTRTNSTDVEAEMIEQGFRLTSTQSDDRFLTAMARQEVKAVRDGLKQAD